jgi:glycosyltransferase involved in cell wall biosynthesis
MDAVIALARAVPAASVLLLGVKAGSSEARTLQGAARRAGVRNLELRTWVPLTDVPTYLYAADCLVIPPTDEPLRRFRRTVLPMKVFMYLAAGRAILGPRLPDLEEVLIDGETARLTSPDSIDESAIALSEILSNADLRARLAHNAGAAAAAYTWAGRAARIVEFLKRL